MDTPDGYSVHSMPTLQKSTLENSTKGKAMTTAGAVATELRRIADALDKEPEAEITIPSVWFWSYGHKESFLNLMRLMPRPFEKEYKDSNLIVTKSDLTAIHFQARVDRSAVCTLVEPAKPAVYKCEPLLSDEEETALDTPPKGSIADIAPGFASA